MSVDALTTPAARRQRMLPTTTSVLRRVLVPAAIVGAWVAVTYSGAVSSLFLPSPTDLWHSFQSLRPELLHHVLASVGMTLTGFALGCAIGVGLGLLMAYSKVARELFSSVLAFLRPIPVFALIPLFVLWFGIGRAPQITLIALGTSVILGVTTIEAIRNVAPVHIQAALTLGASRREIYQDVIVPSIFPHLLGAIRVAAAVSWGLDVAAEFVGAQSGLGYIMIIRTQYLDTAGIVLIVLIYSVLALILDRLVQLASVPLTRWTPRSTTQGAVASVTGAA